MGARWPLLGFAISTGCVALNPVYADGDGGTSGASVTSGPDRTTGPKAEDSGVDTTDETTQGPQSTTTPLTGGPPATETGHDASTSLAPDDTGVGSGDTGTDTTPVQPPLSVIVFASIPIQGNFSSGTSLATASADLCAATSEDADFGLSCDPMLGVIAPAGVSFEDVVATTPGLDGVPLLAPDFETVADSFGELLDGNVEAGFGPRVTDHLGGDMTPQFWWTPPEVNQPDCGGWMSAVEATGQTRTFDSSGAGMVLEGINPCVQLHHLLCACVTQD